MKNLIQDPLILTIDEEGQLYDCKSYAKMLSINELIALKYAVDRTYNYYLENNVDEDYINDMNQDSYEMHIKMMNDYVYGKKDVVKLNGYVYLMVDNRNGLTKIGFSKYPEYREKTLQSEVPDIEMIFYEKGSIKIEKEIHKAYEYKRVRGEWFNLNMDDIEEIKNFLKNGAQL